MLTMRSALLMLLISLMALIADAVSGQDFPGKSIRIITGGIGSNGDFASRILAQGISAPLGQPVVVENRSSNITAGIVAKAPADGYTLLAVGSSLWNEPLIQKTSYDPVRDFSPISLILRVPNVVTVHPSLPVKSVKELIALANARPGDLSYGSSAGVSGSYIAGESFKSRAGIIAVRIPYKDDNLRVVDLIAGRVQFTIAGSPIVMPYVKAGKLRALAVASLEPSALLPGLPTVTESGLPGYVSASFSGVLAPAKTPDSIIKRLNYEINRLLQTAEVKEKFLNIGSEAVGGLPEEFVATMKSEMATVSKVIKDAGIKAE